MSGRHRWSDGVGVFNTATGNDQTVRRCQFCRLEKITVHPPQGLPWREWRDAKGGPQMRLSFTPPCIPAQQVIEDKQYVDAAA